MEETLQLEMVKTLGIPIVNERRRYWFVRTVGGQYREEFIDEKFIGINWNDFSDIDSLKRCKDDVEHKISLRDQLAETFDGNIKKAGRILGQITRFVYEMRKGDVVIIPTENSTKITFGIIESDLYIEQFTSDKLEELRQEGKCDYLKRRKVNWVKTVYRENLDPVLYNMCRAHQTISCCDEYDMNIDRLLEPIYFKNGKVYFTVRVNQANDIKAYDMYSLYGMAYDVLKIDKDSVLSKVNVQSPGVLQWISEHPEEIVIMVLAVMFFIGGTISFSDGKIEAVELPGILHWFIKNKKLNNEQEIEQLKIEKESELKNKKLDYEYALQNRIIDLEQMRLTAMIEKDSAEVTELKEKLDEYKYVFERLEISLDQGILQGILEEK